MLLAVLVLLSAPPVHAESVTLNLKDADITALINTVSKITGKNFVVDPRVKGDVTVVSARPLDADEVYQVFLSILEVHGFAAIPADKVIKIVPDVKAKQGGVPIPPSLRGLPDDEMVTRVIQVENVEAAQLVPILRPLVPQQGHLAAYPPSNMLIISDRAGNTARLAQIIGRIDQESDSEVELIPLQHASAAEVVRIVEALQQQEAKAQAGRLVRIVADERTNSVLLSGERSDRLRLRTLIMHMDTPLERGGNTRVMYLRYAKAKDLLGVLDGVIKSLQPDEKTAAAASPVSIQADEGSNALVITAPPDIFRSLQTVISQLDVRRAQVMVEAVIAEVSLDVTRELGVQWVVDGTPGNDGAVGIINFGGAASLGGVAAAIESGSLGALPEGALIGGGRFDDPDLNFAVLIRALSNDADTNILSTPSLMTLDNQEAEIVVGQNVPFVTGEFSTTGTAATTATTVNPFRTIQRQDVGLTLKVRPQINEGNAVKLEVEQEVSSLSPSAVDASDLITNKRSIKTTVMVEDGHIVVLGGLIDEDLKQTHQRVPGLGDLPVLGRLFRFDRTTKVKRNLLVFLRPAIVRDAATQAQTSGSKYSYLRAKQLEARRRGVFHLPDEEAPVLPESYLDLPPPFDDEDPSDSP